MTKQLLTVFATISLAANLWALEPSGTLPVIYINTDNGEPVTSKSEYVNATYWLDPMGDTNFEPIGSRIEPLKLQIKGRGNWSWNGFEKKPYRIKLDKKAPLMGMNSSKHFALMAHADDRFGFLRNAVGFKLGRIFDMEWTPEEQPVELVMNGEYLGLYFLTETIRIDKDRVNITEQADYATDPEEITGGWLVEIDNYSDDPHVTVMEGDSDYPIWFTYKSPEELSPEQEAYLTQQMSDINDAIYNGDTQDCAWAGMVDLESFAKYYIIQEIVDDYESFHGSCYMFKGRGVEEKWHFGPLWDFGNAFTYNKQSFIYQGREHHQVWIGKMCQFMPYMEVVEHFWREFYANGYQEIMTFVDDYARRIADASARDFERWPQYGTENEMASAALVKQRLRTSCSWLANQWGGVPEDLEGASTVYFVDDIENSEFSWNPVYAYTWNTTNGMPAYLGNYPGTIMSPTTIDGQNGWKISFVADETNPIDQLGLIFNDGNSGLGYHQTEDLKFEEGKVYYRSQTASLGENFANNGISITPGNGELTITTDTPSNVTVSRIDGTTFVLRVAAGTTTYRLPRGIYIIGHSKYML